MLSVLALLLSITSTRAVQSSSTLVLMPVRAYTMKPGPHRLLRLSKAVASEENWGKETFIVFPAVPA